MLLDVERDSLLCVWVALCCSAVYWNEDGREGNVLFGSLLDDGEERKKEKNNSTLTVRIDIFIFEEGRKLDSRVVRIERECVILFFIFFMLFFQGLKFLTSLVSLDRV